MGAKKRFSMIALFALLTTPSAFAHSNQGKIVVQGVVPDTWEVTIYDMKPDYYFNLSSSEESLKERIGTIHMYANNSMSTGGHLFIESANAGQLMNTSSDPTIASEHQRYEINLEHNTLRNHENTVHETTPIPRTHPSIGYDLAKPATVELEADVGIGNAVEGTYDVLVFIPDTGRPQASVLYTDTITFTIIDDN